MSWHLFDVTEKPERTLWPTQYMAAAHRLLQKITLE